MNSHADECGCCPNPSPIVIDLQGDGLRFSNAEDGVLFDINGLGLTLWIGWPKDTDDAWLVRDRDSNGMIDSGAEMFGNATLLPVETPPFYGMELALSVINTMGGPQHNSAGQTLNKEGKPIPRLYSVGELGSFFSLCYTGGTNIPEAHSFGRIAGEHAAVGTGELRGDRVRDAVGHRREGARERVHLVAFRRKLSGEPGGHGSTVAADDRVIAQAAAEFPRHDPRLHRRFPTGAALVQHLPPLAHALLRGRQERAVVVAVLDNLLKGAATNAIQIAELAGVDRAVDISIVLRLAGKAAAVRSFDTGDTIIPNEQVAAKNLAAGVYRDQ